MKFIILNYFVIGDNLLLLLDTEVDQNTLIQLKKWLDCICMLVIGGDNTDSLIHIVLIDFDKILMLIYTWGYLK